jgi:hypothetical protein
MINFKKTLYTALFICAIQLGISNDAYGNNNSDTVTIKLTNITKSPDVHQYIRDVIPIKILADQKYDLRKFKPEITLKEVSKKMRGKDGDYAYEILTRIHPIKNKVKNDEDIINVANNEEFRKLAAAFQRAEAEAVFYRDLKRIMDDNHIYLKDIKEYQNMRTINNKIVTSAFNVTEGWLESDNFAPNKNKFSTNFRNFINELDYDLSDDELSNDDLSDDELSDDELSEDREYVLKIFSKREKDITNSMKKFREENNLPK